MPVRPTLLRLPARCAAASAAVLLLAACSGSGTASSGATAGTASAGVGATASGPASAPPQATATPGATATPSRTASAGPVDPALTKLTTAMRAAMQAKGSVQLDLSSTAGGLTGTGAMRLTDQQAGAQVAFDLAAGGTTVKMVGLGADLYVKLAQLGTDKWVHLSADGTDPLSVQLKPVLEQLAQAGDVGSLAGAAGTVLTDKGTGSVGGRAVHVYEISKPGAEGRATLRVGDDDLPVDVVTESAGGAVTIAYRDWGAPVDIAAPAAADTVEPSQLGATG